MSFACVNTSLKEYKDLLEQTGLPEMVLQARIIIWQKMNDDYENFPKYGDIIFAPNVVNANMKAISILSSPVAKLVFDKGTKNKWSLSKILTELRIPKEQQELILPLNETTPLGIITSLLANYSFTVEINTRKDKKMGGSFYKFQGKYYHAVTNEEVSEKRALQDSETPTQVYSNLTVPGGINYTENEIATPGITPSIKGHAQFATDNGIGWFRSDERIGGEKGSRTWTRDKNNNEIELPEERTIRRILELQSDLFQKGRDKEDLISNTDVYVNPTSGTKYGVFEAKTNLLIKEFDDILQANDYIQKASNSLKYDIKNSKNQFLQLLNKDNNWVTFFVKSIVQDSAKKGYEKVLFPTGNTASKIEGHTTLEEFKKQKEDRIKELEKQLKEKDYVVLIGNEADKFNDSFEKHYFNTREEAEKFAETVQNVYDVDYINANTKNEINQLKQELERIEGPEGFGALKPIYNFYENTVANILRKQGYNTVLITDEYGNTWNELTIDNMRDNSEIMYQLNESRKNLEKALPELDNYLLDFLKAFNVKTKEFDELKSRLGVDALGATDVLNKLIWYVKNRNEETIPEESAHMLVALMGERHPDIRELLDNIKNWSEYESIKRQYLPIYKDEEKVKIEAIGKLISKALVKNYKAEGLDKNKLQKVLDRILQFIEDILDSVGFSNLFTYNENIADHIAINILSGNKDYIYKIKNTNPNLNAKEEIERNPHAKEIINLFSSNNVKMTGSLAIAGTENIRRPQGQGIHDIDFKVKSFEVFNKEVLPKIPENAVPAHYGWHKKSYSTFAYLIPLEGYRIDVIERKNDFSNGSILNYKLFNERNEEVEITQKNIMAVDFFVYKEGANQKDFDFSSEFIPASLVYEGKMSLGGKSNPYFFSRDKDQEDYILRNPQSFVPFEKHIYYQASEIKPGVAEVFEQNPELVLIGTAQDYSDYLDTVFPESKVKDIVYHGTDGEFDKFDKKELFKNKFTNIEATEINGFWFSESKEMINEMLSPKKILSVLINTKNPLIKPQVDYLQERFHEKTFTEKQATDFGYDSFILPADKPLFSKPDIYNELDWDNYIVFEPEQIHILGGEEDMRKFQEYMDFKNNVKDYFNLNEEQAKFVKDISNLNDLNC